MSREAAHPDRTFRSRLAARELLCGTFVKTPAYQLVEISGGAGLDFVVLDAEHAVYDPAQMDQCLLAARATRTAGVVRLPDSRPETILRVLDMGASGILVPHVADAGTARAVVSHAHYRNGTRGYSNSPRAGGYGAMAMAEHIDLADSSVSVLCQIEDRDGVERVEEIAAVEGVDCLFIGRADLAVSYGVYDLDHPLVGAAVERIARAGVDAGVPVGIFLGDVSAVPSCADLGISLYVIGSDQGWLRAAAASLVRQVSAGASRTAS